MGEPQARQLVDRIVSRLHTKPPRGRKVGWWLLLGLVLWGAALSGSVWLVLRTLPPSWIVARWQADFTQVDLATARQRLVAAPSLGEPGVRFLVASLRDPRPGVRHTAQRVLENEIRRWRSLPLPQASRQLAWVTRELVKVADALPADQHTAVESWLTDWLTWPLDAKTVDALEVLENCERSLAALAQAQRHRDLASARRDQHVPPSGSDAPTDVPPAMGEPLPLSPPTETSVSTRGVQWSVDDESESARALSDSADASVDTRGPQTVGAERLPGRTALVLKTVEGGSLDDERPRPDAFGVNRHDYGALQSETPTDPRTAHIALSRSDIELARQLASPAAAEALAAADELRRRGYSGRAIAVLERLFDPDPSQRLAAVDMLPSLRELDAVVWLERLLDDPHAAVRQRAVAILGSQPTPRVRQSLARRRDLENDAAIRAMLERILR